MSWSKARIAAVTVLALVLGTLGGISWHAHQTSTPVAQSFGAAGNYAFPVGPAGGGLSGTFPNPTVPPVSAAQTAAPTSALAIVPGSLAWWDVGASGVTAGTAPDQSGNGNNVTSLGHDPSLVTGGQGGRTYWHFSGAQVLAGGPATVSPPYTIWCVCRTAGGNGLQTIATFNGANLFLNDNNGGSPGFVNSYASGFFSPSTALNALTASSVAVSIGEYYLDGGAPGVGQFRMNGQVVLTTGNSGSAYSPAQFIGATSSVAGNALVGDIYELAVWGSQLTSAQLSELDAYAASKYQIATANSNLLVFDGNSFVAGNGASGSGYYLGQQTLGLLGTQFASYVNNGVGAEATPAMNTYAIAHTDPLVSSGGVRNLAVAVEVEGTNDIYFGASAATAYADMQTACATRRAAGFKCVVTTILSRSNAGTPAGFNATRAAYNALIRAGWIAWADGLADWASDSRMGANGAETNATYFSGDDVHPSDVGYAILAGYLAQAIQAIPTQPDQGVFLGQNWSNGATTASVATSSVWSPQTSVQGTNELGGNAVVQLQAPVGSSGINTESFFQVKDGTQYEAALGGIPGQLGAIGGLWLGPGANPPSSTNYAIFGTGAGNTYVNGVSNVNARVSNVDELSVTASSVTTGQPVGGFSAGNAFSWLSTTVSLTSGASNVLANTKYNSPHIKFTGTLTGAGTTVTFPATDGACWDLDFSAVVTLTDSIGLIANGNTWSVAVASVVTEYPHVCYSAGAGKLVGVSMIQ